MFSSFFGSPTCFVLWKSLKTKGAWCQTKSPMLGNRPYFTEDGHFWLTDCRIVVTFSLGIPQWQRSPFHTTSLCSFWHHLPWHISYTHSWRARCALAAGRHWRWPNFGQPFSLCLAESCFNGMALRLFPETEVQVPKYVTCSFSMIHISPLPIIFSSGYLLFSFSPNETATSWHSRRGWKIRKTWRSRKWRKNTSTNGGLVLRRVAEKTNLEVKNTENVHLKTLKAM